MNKRIRGEDIILAIGELPEELLTVRSRENERFGFGNYKKLALAASIVLFVGIFAVFAGQIFEFSKAFDPAVGGNAAPPENNAPNLNADKTSILETIRLTSDGELLSEIQATHGYVHINEDGNISIEIILDGEAIPTLTAYFDESDEAEEILPKQTIEGSAKYEINISEITTLKFNFGDETVEIKLYKFNSYAEFEIIKPISQENQ